MSSPMVSGFVLIFNNAFSALASASLPLFIRFGEETTTLDLSPDATVGDVYAAASQTPKLANCQFLLRFAGETLHDDTASISDKGIGAEAVIDVLLMNDFQILNALIPPDRRRDVWKMLTYGCGDCESCDQFESIGDIMQISKSFPDYSYATDYKITVVEGRIKVIGTHPGDLPLNLKELWRLRGMLELACLMIFDYYGVRDLDLSVLQYLQNLEELHFLDLPKLRKIVFPSDMSACRKLNLIVIQGQELRKVDLKPLSFLGSSLTVQIAYKMRKVLVNTGNILIEFD